MSNTNTGGPAFPAAVVFHDQVVYEDGMNLRDYFAAKAMPLCPLRSHSDAARWCYQIADAMLKARG